MLPQRPKASIFAASYVSFLTGIAEHRLVTAPLLRDCPDEALARWKALRLGRGQPGGRGRVPEVDPATIRDTATFAKPQQLARGVDDVFINGVQVLKDGKHTGATPGRFVRGPGWTGWPGRGACK